jgi:hypothetical protein
MIHKKMTSRSDVLLKSITEFYDDPGHYDLLKGILEKKSGVSLRNLEWFITDYSRKKNFTYTTKSGKLFSVHMSYKSSLDGYSKKLFDPFCRTQKIEFRGTKPPEWVFLLSSLISSLSQVFKRRWLS